MKESKSARTNYLLLSFYRFIRDRFDLDADKADELETISYMEKAVEFKGPNLWILIFAIIIASVGLNVNSTAVIIGAMLISPLMSPILGIGMSVAINDLDFLKKSFKNLFVATLVSVAASTLYFFLTPLSDAQSELLARTNPTIWDVLIAFFGGLAGIVAGSRKEKSNAIPGVAIATALMPPLCTAGYGLATGNMYYFIGAFYLFFINGVCISLATFLIVRLLKYPKKEFSNVERERKVRRWIAFFVAITIVPSIYLAYQTVQRSIFERNARAFISTELALVNTRVIDSKLNFSSKKPVIEVSLFGKRISGDSVAMIKKRLNAYQLEKADLIIFQGESDNVNEITLTNSLRSGIMEELYKQSEKTMKSKDERIDFLENELIHIKQTETLSKQVAIEAKALYPTLGTFSLSKTIVIKLDSAKQDTTYIALVSFKKRPGKEDMVKLGSWLKTRVNSKKVEVVVR